MKFELQVAGMLVGIGLVAAAAVAAVAGAAASVLRYWVSDNAAEQ